MKCMVSIGLRPQDEEKILPLVAEEQARVQMLSEQGVIEARYISADRVHVWLVVQRESQNQVQKDLESMPIYPSIRLDLARKQSTRSPSQVKHEK